MKTCPWIVFAADAIKTVATPFGKKIKGKVWKQKPEITDTDEESGRVWDESLAQMEISKKRHSVVGDRYNVIILSITA